MANSLEQMTFFVRVRRRNTGTQVLYKVKAHDEKEAEAIASSEFPLWTIVEIYLAKEE
jgi:hypothetical protein